MNDVINISMRYILAGKILLKTGNACVKGINFVSVDSRVQQILM